jgi:hypothetical protein
MTLNSPTFIELGQGLSLRIGLPTISQWTNLRRPKNAKKGTFGFNTDTSCVEYWDGKNWYKASLSA